MKSPSDLLELVGLVCALTVWVPFVVYLCVAMGTCAYYRSKHTVTGKLTKERWNGQVERKA